MNSESEFNFLTADELLTKEWPEPVWAVPGLLPAGLNFFAGAAKIGKSWFALQLAQAVASGGVVLGERVEQGPVLYLALEDPPRRLQERMNKQKWPLGLEADFITLVDFQDQIGDLQCGGNLKLAKMIEIQKYRIVILDTFSRSISGDQNDVAIVTEGLTPVQMMAHNYNCAVLLIDHHKKRGNDNHDPIADILGSTAKGAMADTVLGLYTERGKSGAKLSVTGREVEYQNLDLKMDWLTGCWQLENGVNGLTTQSVDLLVVLEDIGPSKGVEIADAVDRNKGNVYKQLVELEKKGHIYRDDGLWKISDDQETKET